MNYFEKPRLGINIDHVATLRQARGEDYPSIVRAAELCLENGADQITIHLREDRRHIQDMDVETVRLVTQKFKCPLNLEMGCNQEIIDVALATLPDWVCIVPEKREERTTEGGLDLLNRETREKVKETCQFLKEKIPNLKISLFIEAKEDVIRFAKECFCDAVEIHTGDFAMAYLNEEDCEKYIKQFQDSKKLCDELGLNHHAGHGLTDQSVLPLLNENLFEEYNIGHWVISEGVFVGIGHVVKKLKNSFS